MTEPELTDSSSVKVYIIAPHAIEKIWGEAGPMLARAVEHGDGNFMLSDVFDGLVSGDMQLWVAHSDKGLEGALVSRIAVFPRKKMLSVMYLAGRHRKNWWKFYPHLEGWAKQMGCVGIEAYAREGLLKWLPDWRRCYSVIRKDF